MYLKDNIKFYNAKQIPRFNQKNPDGVTKTEYDSDLTNSLDITEEEFLDWIM